MTHDLSAQDWDIRLFIYRFFVENGRPPTLRETASEWVQSVEEARRSYHRLHQRHAIFLEPGTDDVRIANPLSAVPTPYQVSTDGKMLYASCAWDSLGIPAMLHRDASIEAFIDGPDEPVRYAIEHGALVAGTGLVVHFALPFARWYDDLIHT